MSESVWNPSFGSVVPNFPGIFCASCLSDETAEDNDILICDGDHSNALCVVGKRDSGDRAFMGWQQGSAAEKGIKTSHRSAPPPPPRWDMSLEGQHLWAETGDPRGAMAQWVWTLMSMANSAGTLPPLQRAWRVDKQCTV